MNQVFEIWMEGYAATGERGTAQKIGEYEAETFDEAVEKYTKERYPNGPGPRDTPPRKLTDKDFIPGYYEKRDHDWSIWGCALYDNEQQARKSFG